MAVSNLLALIDDIASVLDDVAVLTKVATQKTVGVLGDDLALNAQQVAGVRAERELPVVWAVAKGSMINKAILVPAALAISALAPWAVTPLLMVGGLYLCYEGCEKLAHKYLTPAAEDQARQAALRQALADPNIDMAALERDKIKGAIRTDFVLSAEIIAITLGAVAQAEFMTQVLVLCGIAVAMTVGVYGIVAGIVKLDDLGLWLSRRAGASARIGRAILRAAPWLMKTLSVAGTVAMFLVGGLYLCYEGCEKLAHKYLTPAAEDQARQAALRKALADPNIDLAALEGDKIKGAIRTDFVLSAEIIAITLGAVAQAELITQVLVLCGIAVAMTVGVYGIVAGIVKLDDLGLWLSRRAAASAWIGRAILRAAPWLMKTLSVAGTVAMFLVGGGILTHGVPALDRAIEDATAALHGVAQTAAAMTANALVGVAAGAVALVLVALAGRWRRSRAIAAG